MGKFLVGLGLVVMMSAMAFHRTVTEDPNVSVAAVNSATSAAVWMFIAGVGVALLGALRAAR